MRLSKYDIETIKFEAKNCFGEDVRLWLFGSRVNDAGKGGDIDLYVETKRKVGLEQKHHFMALLQLKLGDQKIDVVLNCGQKEKEIFKIAKETGTEL